MHRDSYGINLVIQAHGSKRWVFLPPESKVYERRVPWDDTTAWADKFLHIDKKNDVNSFETIERILRSASTEKDEASGSSGVVGLCDLHAGDLLFVPHSWKHCCLCLTDCLSINQWLDAP